MSQFFINLNISSPERFDMAKFMEYTDNYDMLTSRFMLDLVKIQPQGYFVIEGDDGRPDIVSYKIYNDEQYWWVLMMYNKIIDTDEIVSGKSIIYPPLADLEALLFSMKSKEFASK